MQLEMHFFDNMPHSVKYAVEFVAKQLSSHCENSLRENIIPKIKSKLSVCLKNAYIQKMSSVSNFNFIFTFLTVQLYMHTNFSSSS